MNQVTTEPKAREEVKRTQHDPKSAWGLGVGALVVLAAVVGWGAWSHIARSSDAETTLRVRQNAVPLIRVMPVKPIDGPSTVELPGTMQAFDAAVLFARATGYIATRNVDIGSRVHAGDVLAVIAAPDLDQQLAQARAQLAQMQAALDQAQANGTLAKVTNQRTAKLVTEGWSTQQQGDNDRLTLTARIASIGSAQANLVAQQAQVNRLVELTGFERVTAPFDGVITARQIDVGSLVTADANGGTSLFSIARTDVLRVQVFVPQENVFGLKDGQVATVTVPQLPGRVFHGTVARNAQALSTNTRTLLAEVDVDNKDGALAAGLYGIVHFEFPRDRPVVMIPSEAIIFDKNGLSAAVFDNGEIHLRHLDLQADNGAQIEVRAGLQPGDQVILNPPLNVTEGMKARTS
jgi:RND family efflux transporter MFP subunit